MSDFNEQAKKFREKKNKELASRLLPKVTKKSFSWQEIEDDVRERLAKEHDEETKDKGVGIGMPIFDEERYREKMEREKMDRELGNTIKNLRTPEEDARMDAFFQQNIIEGRHTIEVSPELAKQLRDWQKSKEDEEITKRHHQGTWVSPEEYDAELREHPPIDPILQASRREAALRQLAGEVTDDVLINLYKECIIARERMKFGMSFGIAKREEIESRLQVYETELGNRLARKGKGK